MLITHHMLSNHCNVTGLSRLLQVNIQVFKIIKWKWRRPLKTGFAQISSRCPKNLSCPNFGGATAPSPPPARTPMDDDGNGYCGMPIGTEIGPVT